MTAADHHWNDLVVVCAANRYDGIKMADRHLAEQLSGRVPVLYVDPPMSPLTPLRNRGMASLLERPRLRIVAPQLAQLTPVVQPGPSRRPLTRCTAALARRQLRRASSLLGGQVRAVISAWPQFPVFGTCRENVRIYWAQDDFVGGASLMGLHAGHLAARERMIAGSADLIVAVSPPLAGAWQGGHSKVALIPNGADVDAYRDVDRAQLPLDVDLAGPVAGFVGHINGRTDLRLIEAIAARGRSLLLVGPKDADFEPDRFAALLRRDNVRWVGAKPFSDLPGYLRLIDVGLVPYGDSRFNRGSFPLKTLEYLAAGRAVVATDLPAIKWLATDLVTVASGPEEFADQVDLLLGQARTPAVTARRREFAAQHSWSSRAASLHDAILGVDGSRPAVCK
jgi:glycosyltransferase involved in cell wall biosynthesis